MNQKMINKIFEILWVANLMALCLFAWVFTYGSVLSLLKWYILGIGTPYEMLTIIGIFIGFQGSWLLTTKKWRNKRCD